MSREHYTERQRGVDGTFASDISEDDRISIVADYVAGKSMYPIAERLGIARKTVRRILIESGVKPRPKSSLSDADDETKATLIQRYRDGEGAPEIAKSFGCGYAAVYRILTKAGVPIRSQSEAKRVVYPLRDDAFDEPLSPDARYWIGMLMADGCITQNRNALSITLVLQERDRAHVERFVQFLGSNNVIISTHRFDNGLVKSRDGKGFKSAGITVTSRRMVESLARYGVVPRKSKTAKVIGLEMDSSFWRGVIDGDGSVFIAKNGVATVALCGSEALVGQFAAYIKMVSPECVARPHPASTIFAVSAHGTHAYRMCEALYGDCTVALDRKLETARKILSKPDPFVNPWVRWDHVTVEMLDALYAEIGEWKGVAERLGMPVSSLSCVRLALGHRTTRRQRVEAVVSDPDDHAPLVQRRLFD